MHSNEISSSIWQYSFATSALSFKLLLSEVEDRVYRGVGVGGGGGGGREREREHRISLVQFVNSENPRQA